MKQGEDFVELLRDNKLAIVNGRFNDSEYTCIRSNGKSVVDYIACDHSTLTSCKELKIYTESDLVNNSENKTSDHAILVAKFAGHNYDEPVDVEPNSVSHIKRIYNYKKYKPQFMNNDNWHNVISNLVDITLNTTETLKDLDIWYEDMCSKIT